MSSSSRAVVVDAGSYSCRVGVADGAATAPQSTHVWATSLSADASPPYVVNGTVANWEAVSAQICRQAKQAGCPSAPPESVLLCGQATASMLQREQALAAMFGTRAADPSRDDIAASLTTASTPMIAENVGVSQAFLAPCTTLAL